MPELKRYTVYVGETEVGEIHGENYRDALKGARQFAYWPRAYAAVSSEHPTLSGRTHIKRAHEPAREDSLPVGACLGTGSLIRAFKLRPRVHDSRGGDDHAQCPTCEGWIVAVLDGDRYRIVTHEPFLAP